MRKVLRILKGDGDDHEVMGQKLYGCSYQIMQNREFSPYHKDWGLIPLGISHWKWL